MHGAKKIVVTGGPGAGKSTALDLFRREIGDRVVVVPESATLLFEGGFPRVENEDARRAAQRAIYHVQRNLEDAQACRYPGRVLLCDRGTLDGAVYWPDGQSSFYEAVGSSEAAELARYDAVLFFETAAVGGLQIEGGNRARNETLHQAVTLDRALREVWSRHPRFVLLEHQRSFLAKLTAGIEALTRLFLTA